MALSFSNLKSATSTTNGSASDSVDIPNNGVCYVAVAVAYTAGIGGALDNMTCTLGGSNAASFTQLAVRNYKLRRRLFLFRAVNTSGSTQSGTITATFSSPGSYPYQEHQYSIDLVTGADTSDPDDDPVVNSVDTGATSLALPDVGTPGAGDAIYAAFAFENGSNSFALSGDLTELGSQTGGANVRSLKTGYDADAGDETPQCSWSTNTNGCGGIALIVNVGAAAGGVPKQMNNILRLTWA
jgi:hypothetical protein